MKESDRQIGNDLRGTGFDIFNRTPLQTIAFSIHNCPNQQVNLAELCRKVTNDDVEVGQRVSACYFPV